MAPIGTRCGTCACKVARRSAFGGSQPCLSNPCKVKFMLQKLMLLVEQKKANLLRELLGTKISIPQRPLWEDPYRRRDYS